jgi:hypothetical protein
MMLLIKNLGLQGLYSEPRRNLHSPTPGILIHLIGIHIVRLKSYFAESVEQAISRASKELGSEAMLVYSRESHAEARYLGSYEVVFSVPAGTSPEVNTDLDSTAGESKEGYLHPQPPPWTPKPPAEPSRDSCQCVM